MRVAVLGAGVVGVATAWRLARDGHEVIVIERREGPGLETSFANGGQISASHAEPWANPTVLPKVLKWLGREDAPLLIRWRRFDPALWGWGLRFLANCTRARARLNTERTLRIALYSRRLFKEWRAETGIAYDQLSRGILHIYRQAKEYEHACREAETMRQFGLARQILDRNGVIAIDPALRHVAPKLAGGLFSPDDESGDAHKFTLALAKLAAEKGVVFRFSETVQGFELNKGRLAAILSDQGKIPVDAAVLALGSFSPLLARQLGFSLPIYPAKGYSVTLPVGPDDEAPQVSLTDDEHKMVYSRLGERLRIAGTAELGGYDPSLNRRRADLLLARAMAIFPKAGKTAQAEFWAGLRPVTPDSAPIIGKSPLPGLFLNTGHGTLGWTMSCGSAHLIADIIGEKKPEIDPTGLGMERF
jgi:D-amino-acid dehydrogenase